MREPTAWINKERDVITFDNLFPEMTPLYEKREWVGLTDEDKQEAYYKIDSWGECVSFIEAKLKEKNT
jgi:hypothetical protein